MLDVLGIGPVQLLVDVQGDQAEAGVVGVRNQRHHEQADSQRHGNEHPAILADRCDPVPPEERGHVAGYSDSDQHPDDLVHAEEGGVQQVGNRHRQNPPYERRADQAIRGPRAAHQETGCSVAKKRQKREQEGGDLDSAEQDFQVHRFQSKTLVECCRRDRTV